MARHRLYRELLGIRLQALMPRLEGAKSLGATAIEPSSVVARWRLGDGTTLVIAANLGHVPAKIESVQGDALFESRPGATKAARGGQLDGATTVALMVPAP